MSEIKILEFKEGSPPKARIELEDGRKGWVHCVMGPSGYHPYTPDVLRLMTSTPPPEKERDLICDALKLSTDASTQTILDRIEAWKARMM
jgi:hypothetical protein